MLLLLISEGIHKMAGFEWILEQERALLKVQARNPAV